MNEKKVKSVIEQSEDFQILECKQNPQSKYNEKDQESKSIINFLQSELNETKNNYEKLFKEFSLYMQKSEELLQKSNQYLLLEYQLQIDLKDQIRILQIKNEQLVQENQELVENKNLSMELLEQLQNSEIQQQLFLSERDQLLNYIQNEKEQLEQYKSKNQEYERLNEDLIQKVQNLEPELEKMKQENNLLEQKLKSVTQQGIQFHLEDIAKKIIEELNQINGQREDEQILQRKQLAQKLLDSFNVNLRKPLNIYDFTFRHDFIDNKIKGQEDIKKKQIN